MAMFKTSARGGGTARPEGGYGASGKPGSAMRRSAKKGKPSGGLGSYGKVDGKKPSGGYGSYGKPSPQGNTPGVTTGQYASERSVAGKVAMPEALDVKVPSDQRRQ